MRVVGHLETQSFVLASEYDYARLIEEAVYFPIAYGFFLVVLIALIYGFFKFNKWIPNINIDRKLIIGSYVFFAIWIIYLGFDLLSGIPLLIAALTDPEYYVYLNISNGTY